VQTPVPTDGSDKKRRLKRLATTLGAVMLFAMASTVYLVHYYGESRPTVEQPGRTHAATIHSRTVYLTNNEYTLAVATHAITVLLIGTFIGIAWKAKFTKG
jgi:hypothetical protein